MRHRKGAADKNVQSRPLASAVLGMKSRYLTIVFFFYFLELTESREFLLILLLPFLMIIYLC